MVKSTGLLLAMIFVLAASAEGHEIEDFFGPKSSLSKDLDPPKIRAAPGFSARVLLGHGYTPDPAMKLYEPEMMRLHGNGVWLLDYGPELQGWGGQILSVNTRGEVAPVLESSRLLSPTGFDVAPATFGQDGGQIFAVAQPKVGLAAGFVNAVVLRLNLQDKNAAGVFCELPPNGSIGGGNSGISGDAIFGPDGSPFANRLFIASGQNATVYEAHADGSCRPFATLAWSDRGALHNGFPTGIAFSPNHQRMLVSAIVGKNWIEPTPGAGVILAVSGDGRLDPVPVVKGLTTPLGITFAPAGFGDIGGQMIIADMAALQMEVPNNERYKRDGKVFRVGPDGKLVALASNFINPIGVIFVGNRLWVSDIASCYIGNLRERPDGFVVEIKSIKP